MDIELLRARTPGTAHRTHLNNAGAALMSDTTLAAVTDHLGLESRIGGYEAADAARDQITATYLALAELLGGRDDQIALFDNSTHAWNAAGYSVPLEPGDRIITGRDEYGSQALAYFQMARHTGAEIVVIDNDEYGQIDLDALRAEVDERTALIGLTWIPTAGGLINPAAEVGAIAREADTLFLLDATQAVGQLPIDVAALGCDLLTGTGRKFLRGPRGTGFLWVGDRALERVEPPVVEIESAEWDGARGFRFVPGARRFASWETSYANMIGLGAAVRQALELGMDEIAERAIALGARLRTGLAEIPGVTTHDLGRHRCAIVTAAVAGHPPDEVQARLTEDGINVSVTFGPHNPFDVEVRDVHPLVRLSPHYYNTEAEIDRALTAVAKIAAG
ncbi:MAG TPA: aminotransferase class V-fold PLP-dependent enzyme [Pseudonocardiaceae bacterium]|nr:aminotransferase class V-fold PLP-dependent enzyme [Pseudonocardiaceae bacterium]